MPSPTPAAVDRHSALARSVELQAEGRPREALAWLLCAMEDHPGRPEVWVAAGRALLDAGEPREAEQVLRQAVHMAPESADAWVALGCALEARRICDEPVSCWRKAIELDRDHVEARVRLGAALAAAGEHEASGEHLGVALGLEPEDSGAIAAAASLFQLQGDAEAAWRLIDRYRGTDPRIAVIAASAGIRIGRSRQALSRVERALRAARIPSARISLLRARGDLLDVLGRSQEAFSSWNEANLIQRASFDPDQHEQGIDDLVDRTSERTWPTTPAPSADRPVLIVGPPRSGTGLLERLLARHPSVAAGRNVGTLRELAAGLPQAGEPYWACALDRLTESDTDALRAKYLAALDAVDPDAPRITDRTPDNLFLLGLLATFLPGARVIRCVRDPMDTALSCFHGSLGPEAPWATSIPSIAAWLKGAARIADHWEATLPLRTLTVRYEALAREPERVLHEVLDFLDLPFDPVVLSLESGPIHAGSVGRSRRYAAHLAPWFAP